MSRALIDEYLAGAGALRGAVAGMSRADQNARPIAGKWSTLEVVCHVADMDGVHAERMKRVIAEDNPTLPDADETRWAAALKYEQREIDEELAAIEATRKQMVRILSVLPAEAFARQGVHTSAGPLTLEQLLARVTRHLPHHVKFIEEKRLALGVK